MHSIIFQYYELNFSNSIKFYKEKCPRVEWQQGLKSIKFCSIYDIYL